MGFSRREHSSTLLFPPPGDLPDPGIEPASPALQPDSLPLNHLGSPFSVFVASNHVCPCRFWEAPWRPRSRLRHCTDLPLDKGASSFAGRRVCVELEPTERVLGAPFPRMLLLARVMAVCPLGWPWVEIPSWRSVGWMCTASFGPGSARSLWLTLSRLVGVWRGGYTGSLWWPSACLMAESFGGTPRVVLASRHSSKGGVVTPSY